MRPLFNQEQAADYLGIKQNTLEGWRHKGGGPPFVRISARCIRYRPEDLDEWIAARLAASTSATTEAERAAE